MTTKWTDRYALRTQNMTSSAIREILKVTQMPDVISFAGGMPAPELFPVAEIEAAAHKVLSEQGPASLQYSTTEGYPPLRQFLVDQMARYGIVAGVENVLITNGSQQGLDLIGKIFLDRGDVVLVEDPTYLGAIQAWRPYEAGFSTIPIDGAGMRMEYLETMLIEKRPKFIYALPNFHNPAGVTLPLARRQRLVDLANHYGVPILEDDPYGALRYSGDHIPPILVLDAQRSQADNGGGQLHQGDVIYLGTFSKTLAPGFRLGWVVAPDQVIRRLVQAKQGCDLHTTTFGQMVVYEAIRDGFLGGHLRTLRRVYRSRRDVMLAAMAEHFPPGITWTTPDGGLFLWVTLPQGMDSQALLTQAVAEKVAYVPGAPFFANGGGQNTLRLNFSNAQPEQIQEGIARLGRVFAQALAPGMAVHAGLPVPTV